MSATLRWSTAARGDLRSILANLTTDAGQPIATRYARDILAALDDVANFPGQGAPRPAFGALTRFVSVKPYLIFYDGGPESDVVHILRIVHERRRITAAFIAKGR